MDAITKIPGLQHISEDIFKLLDTKSLMNCRLTNLSWKNVPDQLIFWLKKLKMEGWKALAKNFENPCQRLPKRYLGIGGSSNRHSIQVESSVARAGEGSPTKGVCFDFDQDLQ